MEQHHFIVWRTELLICQACASEEDVKAAWGCLFSNLDTSMSATSSGHAQFGSNVFFFCCCCPGTHGGHYFDNLHWAHSCGRRSVVPAESSCPAELQAALGFEANSGRGCLGIDQKQNLFLILKASERSVILILIVGVCQPSLHLHICLSSHLLSSSIIFTASQLCILTSWHLHTLTSYIFTSAPLHIWSSSHPHIHTASHPHLLTSSHPHICTSSHLRIILSSHLLSFLLTVRPSCSVAVLLQAIRRCVESEVHAVDVGSVRAHMVTFTTEGIAYYTASCYTMRLLLSFVSSITWVYM